MRFRSATIFSAAIGQCRDQAHLLLGKERQDAIIQEIGSRNRRLGRVQFRRRPF